MRHLLRTRPVVLLASACLVAAASAPARSAGLLDFLFGSSASPQQTQPAPTYRPSAVYRSEPLRMSVRPRGYEDRSSKRSARTRPGKRESKTVLATPIDSKSNPGWYLQDPTLRKGDIVVLKGKVLVYEGRRGSSSVDDFASLQTSKLITKGERAQIEGMAGLPAGAPVASNDVQPALKAAASKQVSLQ